MGNESILLTYLKTVFFCLLVKKGESLLTFLFTQQSVTLYLLTTCGILILESIKPVFLPSLSFLLFSFLRIINNDCSLCCFVCISNLFLSFSIVLSSL